MFPSGYVYNVISMVDLLSVEYFDELGTCYCLQGLAKYLAICYLLAAT